MRHKKTTKFDCAENMPPLYHWAPGTEKFDLSKSEVVDWLIRQPSIRSFVFERASPLLVFDKATRKRRGKKHTPSTELEI